jgi:hypothetical protein
MLRNKRPQPIVLLRRERDPLPAVAMIRHLWAGKRNRTNRPSKT